MNNIRIKVYKNLLQDIFDKCGGAEDFINEKIKEICSHEKSSAEEVI